MGENEVDMISECEINSDLYLSNTPQAPPGISGKLISKCRKLRLSYMASPAKAIVSPTVYKIGAQIYLVRWYGTVPCEKQVVDWQNAFFVRRKEVPIEDEKVQEALAATFVMLRMDQQRQQQTQYDFYGSSSPTYWSTSSGYATVNPYYSSSTYPNGYISKQGYSPYGIANVTTSTYNWQVAQQQAQSYQNYQSCQQAPSSSGLGSVLGKLLGKKTP